MTDILKKLQDNIIKLAESQETDFLLLVKSVYGDTPDSVLKSARFASYIYENDKKEKKKILLECRNELKATGNNKYIAIFKKMFPELSKENQKNVVVMDDANKTIEIKIKIPKQRFSMIPDKYQKMIDSMHEDAQKEIESIEESFEVIFKHEGNKIEPKRLAQIREELKKGVFSKADELFAQIEQRKHPIMQRAACVACARGKIAKEELRWVDAAKHYAHAAQLYPCFKTLIKAQIFAHNIGDYDSALSLGIKTTEAAIEEYGEESQNHANSLNNLAEVYKDQGKYKQSELLHNESLKIRKNLMGKEHPDIASSLNNFGGLYQEQHEYKKAESLFIEALNIRRKTLGKNDPETAASLSNLGENYRAQGKNKKAESFHNNALRIRTKILGENHPDTANSIHNLAGLYYVQKKYDKAEIFYYKCIKIHKEVFGEYSPITAMSLNNLGALYYSKENYKEAESFFKQALSIRKKTLEKNHPDIANTLSNIGGVYYSQGKYKEAEPFCKKALVIFEINFGIDHPTTKNSKANYDKIKKELITNH